MGDQILKLILISLVFIYGLFAVTPNDQSIQQPPDTTLQFDPETGLPAVAATEVADEYLTPFQAFARKPFPIQYFVGMPIEDGSNIGSLPNLAISYNFAQGSALRDNGDIYELFYWYPKLTLGIRDWYFGDPGGFKDLSRIIKSGHIFYGLIEGHRQWERKYFRASVFVGVGLGSYSQKLYETEPRTGDYIITAEYLAYLAQYKSTTYDAGIDPVYSAGAQLQVGRLLGGIRLNRMPGLDKTVIIANVGYQPKYLLEGLITGIPAAVAASLLVWFIVFGPPVD